MRVIVQRVRASAVQVQGETIGKINQGLNLLVGLKEDDTEAQLQWMADKCLRLRLFEQWTRSVVDIGGEILVVSQFTLYGDCRKGTRPSFSQAAKPDQAEQLYDRFVTILRASNLNVQTGKFGAMMEVDIINDGPVTLILEK